MKNIHLIATDKPSRLHSYKGVLNLAAGEFVAPTIVKNDLINLNIYITSDEEIKVGDWYFNNTGSAIEKLQNRLPSGGVFCKKIILTTDQDLIKDGVQAIDDEFLEWFVKNPSCESVKVKLNSFGECHMKGDSCGCYDTADQSLCKLYYPNYKIIIPIEELTMIDDWLDKHGDPEIYKKVEKQLELEEAAENYLRTWRALNNIHLSNIIHAERCKNDFIAGAKWQHQQSVDFSNINANNITTASTQNQTLWKEMYSEEEVKHLIHLACHHSGVSVFKRFEKWFEQFKKK